MKPLVALIDLIAMVVVITATWSLRFLGVPFVGAITMAVGIALVFGILRVRGQTPEAIGLVALPPARKLISEAGRLLPWFGKLWGQRQVHAVLCPGESIPCSVPVHSGFSLYSAPGMQALVVFNQ